MGINVELCHLSVKGLHCKRRFLAADYLSLPQEQDIL